LKKKYFVHQSLLSFKKHKRIKSIIFFFVFIVIILMIFNSVSIGMDRLKLGLEQGLIIVEGMINLDFSYAPKLVEGITISFCIAVFATISGAIGALLLSYFTAYNASPNKWIALFMKVIINVLRTFPPIVTAIIFFRGVGPGPLAGAMALSVYTTGVLTKLYSEVIESSHENIKNSIAVTGCTNLNCFRHGIVPQTFPMFLSLVLYRLESNIRNSTILGIIGAGGIGTILTMNITWRNWERVGFLILGIASMIIFIDTISQSIRRRLS